MEILNFPQVASKLTSQVKKKNDLYHVRYKTKSNTYNQYWRAFIFIFKNLKDRAILHSIVDSTTAKSFSS